ncbi:MAG: ligase-associated DNA damage response DEXH box helicase [Phycisphaerales bacterium]|nr:ligase-associated DNA damage response DEXH box helicase [Phycisphaerales bacterium]
MPTVHPAIEQFFASRGWSPFEFQLQAWQAYLDGRSGLINAPTGVGKTMAAWLGPVIERLRELEASGGVSDAPLRAGSKKRSVRPTGDGEPIRVLWITPLRALANDTLASLLEPTRALGLPWTIESRTGDTSQSLRKKQKDRLPTAMVTTPESLTLLLSHSTWRERFATLRTVVVDEWHELIGTKRGVQMELALARLRTLNPALRTWGVSATIGNLEQARDVLLGVRPAHTPALVRGQIAKDLQIHMLIPRDIERFPWAGHLGTRSVDVVIERIRAARSTLLFTNTRSQAEIWFGRLLAADDDLIGQVAIHHGSLDRGLRQKVENMLAAGSLRCVVCTSSLDLGVDFSPVDQVIQLGSPKGVARLLQRAGRSGHQPGATSRVLGVPTHAFELVEFAAAREAAEARQIESRPPQTAPLDVLAQHLVTIACAEAPAGFDEAVVRDEVRSTYAYRDLSDIDWHWAMDFVKRGGQALTAYPHFARVAPAKEHPSRWTVASDRIARTHRMTIGTITGENSLAVKYLSGRSLGHVEEGFISRLEVGARFVFAGKILEILRVRDNTVFVQRTRKRSGVVSRWDGGRFSLSTQLSAAVRGKLADARSGVFIGPEMEAMRPILELQMRRSTLPGPDELLIESIQTPDAYNVFIFPFEGRMAHEGLGALLAHRITLEAPATITANCNDYGLVLRSQDPLDLPQERWAGLLSTTALVDDLMACVNSSSMARRQFRDIARVAGLVVPGFPGQSKPGRHLQASSEMFFDVFEEFDPENLLLRQARREVLDSQLELGRIRTALERMSKQTILNRTPEELTPLSFPLWAEHLRSTSASTEKWSDVVAKMSLELEQSATGDVPRRPRTKPKKQTSNSPTSSRKPSPRARPATRRRPLGR